MEIGGAFIIVALKVTTWSLVPFSWGEKWEKELNLFTAALTLQSVIPQVIERFKNSFKKSQGQKQMVLSIFSM